MTTLGQAQQSDPFTAAANLGKIVGGITAPTTVKNTTQLSPLNTIGSLASAGTSIFDAVNKGLGKTSYKDFGGLIGSIFGGGSDEGPELLAGASGGSVPAGLSPNTDAGYNNLV
jgi:hypothetical protein